jgi:hypothetical protein
MRWFTRTMPYEVEQPRVIGLLHGVRLSRDCRALHFSNAPFDDSERNRRTISAVQWECITSLGAAVRAKYDSLVLLGSCPGYGVMAGWIQAVAARYQMLTIASMRAG